MVAGRVRAMVGGVVMLSMTLAVSAIPASAQLKGSGSTVSVAQRRALLAAICDKGVDGQKCAECPSYSFPGDSGFPSSVGPYRLGSFITPKATEAYVALTGCDSKPAGFTGGVLLRMVKGKWKVLRYDSAVDISNCLSFPYQTGTTVLVCTGGGGGQGFYIESVYALYTGPTKTLPKSILSVQSNESACRPTIDEMSFRSWRRVDANGDKKLDLELRVDESHAAAKADDCEGSAPGKVVTHTIAFLFDGQRFTVSPKAKATAMCLDIEDLGGVSPTTYCPTVG